MARSLVSRCWMSRGLYVLIAIVLILIRLMPLDSVPGSMPSPDLLLCVTFVWMLRRPDCVPAGLIVLVFFLEDMLTMRPPGLWALIVLLGTEFMRGRQVMSRELGFLVEWGMVATVMTGMQLIYRLAFMVAFLDQPQLALTVLQLMATIIAYPAVVAVTHYGFGLRRIAPGETDVFGRRL